MCIRDRDYLTTSNKVGLKDKIEDFDNGLLNAHNKNVVVVGGGDTAMDCVRTAIRQQAKSVTCVYRRDKDNMPGSIKEINHAIEEGVNFLFNSQPLEIIGNGKIRNLKVGLTELGEPDNTGRRKPVLVEGSEKLIEMNKLVIAFGYQADPQDFVVQNNIDISDQGLISLNSDIYKYQTSNPKFFAGGDMALIWSQRLSKLLLADLV